MKIDVVNQKKEKVESVDLPENIFGVKWNPKLVHQALLAQLANRREAWAHAKTRAEVRGGGKKPWKQKGTGRARHGSIRSPIWKGGGASHGPLKEKNYSKKINRKMNRLAILSTLSKKFSDNELLIVDKFEGIENKTKEWARVLNKLSDMRSRTALILDSANKNATKAVSNIKKIETISPSSLNVYDLLRNKFIIFEKNSIKEVEKIFKKSNTVN